ncbi:hypothetical protein WJX72_007779 [[Myrmecia] bisecta]|uniref:Cilia- and flagella-associated protein 53 n=1 Tax=[Myrmecia] bisecta TaxID=41462 RepID=A0AAW1Q7B7_9CHLO
MFKARKPAPDARILKLRDYEEKLAAGQRDVKEQGKALSLAVWEVKTNERVSKTAALRQFEALKARREADIERRRGLLAQKLQWEEAQLQQELIASQVTAEQRRAELADRARRLAAAREAERQEQANRLLEQQFRESCDVLREVESHNKLQHVVDQRSSQIMEKQQIRHHNAAQEQHWAQLWEQDRLRKEQQYADNVARARAQYAEIGQLLDVQCSENQARRVEAEARHMDDVAEMKAAWAAQDAAEKAHEQADRAHKQQLAAEVKEFNRMKLAELAAIEAAERDLDNKLVVEAMRRAAEEEAREAAAKEGRRDEQMRYRKHLALLLQKEQQDTAEQDSMIEKALAEQQAKRDAEQAARDAARQRLMDEVTRAQTDQMRLHEYERQKAREDCLAERLAQEADAALAEQAEAEKQARLRREELKHRLDIQAQILAKQQRRMGEEEQKRAEAQQAAAAEQQFQAKVKATLANANVQPYHGRRKVDWF